MLQATLRRRPTSIFSALALADVTSSGPHGMSTTQGDVAGKPDPGTSYSQSHFTAWAPSVSPAHERGRCHPILLPAAAAADITPHLYLPQRWYGALEHGHEPGTRQEDSKADEGVRQPRSGPPLPPNHSWVESLPPSWRPYAHLSRLDKPIGTWLLAWPCFWSIGLAAPPGGPIDLSLLALFGAGAVLLRGAGCTINDLWDQDLDKKVARTRTRPLASGAVTNLQAVAWLAAQLAAGLGVLVQLNPYSQIVGASSLGLVATYPLMKRIMGWPQAFLGLTFNWGALLGWAAVQGACDWAVVLPLYAGGVCWTLVYDTLYAHQDKADDVKVGIRSTALTFGARNREYLAAFAALNVACMAAAGHAAGCGAPFFGGLAAGGLHLGWQVATTDLDDPLDCAAKFSSNWWYGALLFGGIVVDRLLA